MRCYINLPLFYKKEPPAGRGGIPLNKPQYDTLLLFFCQNKRVCKLHSYILVNLNGTKYNSPYQIMGRAFLS